MGERAEPGSVRGLLIVDKPAGPTSHGVVARIRRLAGTRKVGHAGTLDPMATGLLIVGLGPATRLLTFLVGLGKVYRATLRLGWETVTDDAEGQACGPPADAARLAGLSDDEIRAALRAFVGTIRQVPSSVSAVKVAGRRAYDVVRAGGVVELPARTVTIERLDVETIRRPAGAGGAAPAVDVTLEVACSSGTYIRALARDAGRALGVGGHLTALRRSVVGPFGLGEAVGLTRLEADGVAPHLVCPAAAAARLFPTRLLDASQARDLGHGKRLSAAAVAGGGDADAAGRFAAIAPDGRLVGIAEARDGVVRSLVNIAPGIEGAQQ
ncbi:MAG TPA: tRNA pseudouridine(55) synthase TruB [Microbacteriaceae bacterium]|nr:tRNA pseudouridine(55) synthase TruB [Microbacteriaceae bacterium]